MKAIMNKERSCVHGPVAQDEARFGVAPIMSSGWYRAELLRNEKPKRVQLIISWWALKDSNLRLPPCENTTTFVYNNLERHAGLLSFAKLQQQSRQSGWSSG
jgi:hypothetical protein